MALGKLADLNFSPSVVLSGGSSWATALPLSNMQATPYKALPARQLTPTSLVASQFTATFDRPRRLQLVAVLFHTLSLRATYRITVAGVTGGLGAPIYQSAWTRVHPQLHTSMSLTWDAQNWWSGQSLVEDLDTHPRNLWIPLPTSMLATAVQIEIDDHANTDGYFDLGYLWLSRIWTPTFNFERGRKRGWQARDQVDEAPSGRLFTEARLGRRVLNLQWTALSNDDTDRVTIAQARAQGGTPLAVLPDTDDPAVMVQEAFLASVTLDGPTITTPGAGQAGATLTEIIA